MGPQMFGRFGSSSLEFLGLCTQEERQYDSIASMFVYSLKVSVSCESFCCHLIVVKILHMGTTRDHHYFTDLYLQKNFGRESGFALSQFASLQWHGHVWLQEPVPSVYMEAWRFNSHFRWDFLNCDFALWFFCLNVLKGRALTSLHSPMSRNAAFSIQSNKKFTTYRESYCILGNHQS